MRKLFGVLVFVAFAALQNPVLVFGQATPGLIYKPATGAGASILDPNGDGYVSSTTAGFIYNDVDESEISFIPIYQVNAEGTNDVRTGPKGGHTDLVGQLGDGKKTAFMHYDAANNALLFRVRLAGQSKASKGYSFLFNTDFDQFGPKADNFSRNNPGFQYEVVLETNFGISVYDWGNGSANQVVHLSNLDEYFQKSVSHIVYGNEMETGYFYDFYLPLNEVPAAFKDELFESFRISVSTITNAQRGISGVISDILGSESLNLQSECVGGIGSLNCVEVDPETLIPTIDSPIYAGADSISGRLSEPDGSTVYVFKNDVQIGSTTVNNFVWKLRDIDALAEGDVIKARASTSGKNTSDFTQNVTVTAEGIDVLICTEAPASLVQSGNGSNDKLTGSVNVPGGTASSDVIIRGYQADGTLFFSTSAGDGTTTVAYNSASFPSFDLGNGGTANLYRDTNNFFVTAQLSGQCESEFSSRVNPSGTQTPAPLITSSGVTTSTTTIEGTHASGSADIYLYKEGQANEIGFLSNTGHTGNWSIDISGVTLLSGDQIYARAKEGTNHMSQQSNKVVVGAVEEEPELIQSQAPEITGEYIAGTGVTVEGFSAEEPGSKIKVFINGTIADSTEVLIDNTWKITGVAVSANDILTATATAPGETESVLSEGVTVLAGTSAAPGIDDNLTIYSTQITGSSSAAGTLTLYVDDGIIGTKELIGTGAWTFDDTDAGQGAGYIQNELYQGATVTATLTQDGRPESEPSTGVTVTGISSFLIEAAGGGNISTQVAGTSFDIEIYAKEGADGTGNTFTPFVDNVLIYSVEAPVTDGFRLTNNFISGSITHATQFDDGAEGVILRALFTDNPEITGASNSFLVNNPDNVTLASINPSLKYAGEAAFELTLTGTNFVSSSIVRVNGSDRTTNFISSTQIKATVLEEDIASSGTLNISVVNPPPQGTGGETDPITLTVEEPPAPTLTSVSPDNGDQYSTFDIVLTGTGLIGNEVTSVDLGGDIVINGTSSNDDYTELTVNITINDAASGLRDVSVTNPAPLGGTATITDAFTVNSSNYTQFIINEIIGPKTAGLPFEITVSAADGSGTIYTGFTGQADLTFSGGNIDPVTTGNFIDGVWTGNVTVTKADTSLNIMAANADGAGNQTGTSNNFDVVAAAASQYLVTVDNETPKAGSTISVNAQLADEYDNPVAEQGISVSWSSTNGGSFSNQVNTDVNGLAVSDFTTSASEGTSHKLTATDGEGNTGQSSTITTTEAPPTKIVFTTASKTSTAGVSTDLIIIELQDDGDVARPATSNTTITLSSTSGTGIFRNQNDSGNLPNNEITIPAGVSQISFRYRDNTAGSFTLTATNSSLTNDSQGVTINTADFGAFLISLVSPQVNATSFTGVNTLTATDIYGNIITDFDASVNPVVFSVSGDLSEGVISGLSGTGNDELNQAADFTSGVADLTNLSLIYTGPAGDGQITATSGSVSKSESLTITSGAATEIRVETAKDGSGVVAAEQAIISGDSLVVYAIARDISDNFVELVDADWSLSDTTGNVTASDLSENADSSATFTANLVGSGIINASSGDLAETPSGTITVEPGDGEKLVITTQPAGGASGEELAAQPIIQIHDANGNLVDDDSTVVSVAIQSGDNGTISGTQTVSAVNGVATFTDLSLAGAVGENYVLRFTSEPALSSIDSDNVNVSVGAASAMSISTQPDTSVAGQSITGPPAVTVTDAQGNVVPGAEITVSVNKADFASGEIVNTTDVNGIAEFNDLVLNTADTGYVLTFTASGVDDAVSEFFVVRAAAAANLSIASGNSQAGVVTGALNDSLSVVITDSLGNIVSGEPVVFAISSIPTGANGALLENATDTTDASGLASTLLTLGDKTGTYQVTASSGDLDNVLFSAVANAGDAAKLVFLTQPNNTTAGDTLNEIVVQLLDENDNAVETAGTEIVLTLSGDRELKGTDTLITSADGQAAFGDLHIERAGTSYTLEASAEGLTADTSNTFDITPAAATQLAITTHPVGGAGSEDGTPTGIGNVVLETQDEFNNPSTIDLNDPQNVTVSISEGSGNLGGTVTRDIQSGAVTFTDLTLDADGTFKLLFESDNLVSAETNEFSMTNVEDASGFDVALAEAGEKTAGVGFDLNITNARGTDSESLSDSVNVTVTSNQAQDGEVFNGKVNFTAGAATVSGIELTLADDHTLTVEITGITNNETVDVTVVPASANYFTLTSAESEWAAGSPETITITTFDEFDNKATGYNGEKGLTFSGANTSPDGTSPAVTDKDSSAINFGASTTIIFTNGEATDIDVVLFAAETAQLAATDGTVSENEALEITVGDAGLNHFLVQEDENGGQNISAQIAGVPFNLLFTARDEFENTVSGYTGTADISQTNSIFAEGQAVTTGAFVNGILSGFGVALTKSADEVSISAVDSANDSVSGISNTFKVKAAEAAGIIFVQQPSNTIAGEAVTPAVTVQLIDEFDNHVAQSDVSVSLSISDGATLSGSSADTDVNGLATFSSLSVAEAGTGYTLSANGTDLTGATSDSFNISANNISASNSTVSANPDTLVADGVTASTLTITLRDAFNNSVTGQAASVELSGLGNAEPGTVSEDGSTGVYTVALTDTVAENITVSVAVDEITLEETAAIVFQSGAVDASNSIVTANPASLTVGGSSEVTVTLADAFGNAISGVTDFEISLGVGDASIGEAIRESETGTYTFTVTNDTAEEITVAVTANGVAAGEDNITFTAGNISASNSSVSASPDTVVADGLAASTVTITLRDANNNRISGLETGDFILTYGDNAALSNFTKVGNGIYTYELTNTVAEDVTISVNADGTDLDDTPAVTFEVGAISASNSEVSATSPHTADGNDASTITITLQDANNNRIAGLVTDDFSLTYGDNAALSNFTEVGNGIYTYELTNTVAEDVTISVNADGTEIEDKPTIIFEPGAISASNSNVIATSPHTANGTDASTITIELKDANNNAISGLVNADFTIALTGNASAGTVSETETAGTYEVGVTNGTAEIITVTVTADSTELSDTPSVSFNSDSASQLAFVGQPDAITPAGDTIGTITVRLEDNGGNLVGDDGTSVTLGISDGATLVGTKTQTTTNGVATFSDLYVEEPGTGYTLTATSGTLDSDQSNTFDITRRTITITADALIKTYGDDDPALTYEVTSGNLISDVDLTGSLERGAGEDTGTYAITQGGLTNANNPSYHITFVGANLTIKAKNLTLTNFVADGKTYDGTTSVTGDGFDDDRLPGDELTFDYDVAFADSSSGTGKDVNFTNITISGGIDAGNYNLVTTSGTAAADIFKAIPVITSWPTATGITYGETLAESALEDGSADGTFAFTNSTIQPTAVGIYEAEVTFTPTDTVNYTSLTQDVDVDIAQKELTVADATAEDKVYDNTTDAIIKGATLIGIIGTDDVDLTNSTSGIFAQADVGTDITVSTNFGLTGTDAGKYTIIQPTGLTADITGAAVTGITWPTASDIIYGEALSNSTLSGGTADQTGSFTFTDATHKPGSVGMSASQVIFTPDSDNYTAVTNDINVQVLTKELTVTNAAAEDKVYDGETGATITGAILNGVINDDDVALGNLVGSFAEKNVGNDIAVTAALTLQGLDAGNYTLVQPTGLSANITALELTVDGSFTAEDKEYDNTTVATLAENNLTLETIVNGDSVSLANVTLAFATADAGENIKVNITSAELTGDQKNNYTLSLAGAPTAMANIIKQTPVITAWPTASGIIYGQALSKSTLTGGTEQDNIPGMFSFADDDIIPDSAGSYQADVIFTPTDSANFSSVTGTAVADVDVSPKPLTITVNDASRAVDEGDPVFTLADFSTGLAAGDTEVGITGGSVTFALASTDANSAIGWYEDEIGVDESSLNGAKASNYDITVVNGDLEITPASLAGFDISGVADPTVAGISHTVTVTARDTEGNIKTDYTGTITFSSSDESAGLPADYTFTEEDEGVASFSNQVVLKTAGEQWVQAEDASDATKKGIQESITVSHGDADNIAISTIPDQTVGIAFGVTFTVKDAYGNTVTDFAGTLDLSTEFGTIGPGKLNFSSSESGQKKAGLTLLKSGDLQKISAVSNEDAAVSGASNEFNVSTGAGAKLVITTQPAGGTSGEELTQQPVLEIQDVGGNLVSDDNESEVTVSIYSGENGTLAGTKTVTANGGVVTYNNLTLAGLVNEDYHLRFTSPGLIEANTYDFNSIALGSLYGQDNWQKNTAAGGIQRNPMVVSDGQDGTPWVRFTESGGNVRAVASRINDENFSFTELDSTDTKAVFQADVYVGYWGIRVWTGFDQNGDGAIYGASERGPGFMVRSNSTQATLLAPSGNTSVTGISKVSGWVRLKLEMDLEANDGAGAGTLYIQNLTDGDTEFQPIAGLENLNLGLDKSASDVRNYTLWNGVDFHMEGATHGLNNVKLGKEANLISEPVNVTSGAPELITIQTQPENSVAGENIVGPPAVVVTDAKGNKVPGVDITVSLNKNQIDAGSITQTTDVSGIAEFDDLQINTEGTGYILEFDANGSGAGIVTSDAFDVQAKTVSQLAFVEQPGESTAAGDTIGIITVRLEDTAGNLVEKNGTAITLEISDEATLVGTITQTTISGVATFSDLYVKEPGTSYTLTATSSDLDSVQSSAFNITRRAITITADSKSKTYGEADPAFTYVLTSGSLIDGMELNGSLNREDGEDTGAYAIISGGLTNANNPSYDITFESKDLTINPKALTITAADQNKTYGDSLTFDGDEFSATELMAGDEISSITLSSDGAGSVALVDVYDITPGGATGTGLENYDINYVAGSLTVGKADLIITADAVSKEYGAADPAFTVNYTGFVNGEDATDLSGTLDIARTTGEGVGSYTLTPSGLTSDNYSITYETGTLTIDKAALTITADDAEKVYGSDDPEFTVNYLGFKNGEDATALSGALEINRAAGEDVGSYTITPSGLSSENYEFTYESGTLNITPKALAIKADDQVKTYDGNAFTGFTVSYDGFAEGEDVDNLVGSLTFGGTSDGAKNAGTYSIVPGGLSSDNYDIIFENGSLAITKTVLTITADDQSKTYGETFTFDGDEFTTEGLVGDDVVTNLTLSSDGATATAVVDEYVIIPGAATGTGLANYDITYAAGTFTVDKAALTVSADNKTKKYGEEDPEFTVSYDGFITGEDADDLSGTLSITREAGEAVDSYAITPNGLTSANYDITFETGTLEITKAGLTITANDQSKTYGETFTFTGNEFSTEGLVNADKIISVTLSSDGTSSTASAGEYDITPSAANGTGLTNYNITYTKGKLSIDKAPLTVTNAIAENKIYDGTTDAVITGATLSGVIGDDAVSLTNATSATFEQATVGTEIGLITTMTISGADSQNYTLTQPSDLTADITAKELTVNNAVAQNKIFDGTNTALVSGAVLNGVVSGDEVTLTDDTAGFFAQSGVGNNIAVTTNMKLSGADAPNYTLKQPDYLSADITSSSVEITEWPAASEITYGETLAASELSGGAASEAGNFAFADNSIQPDSAGDYSATIIFTPTNENFDSVSGQVLVRVTKKLLTVENAVAQNKVYNGNTKAVISGATLNGVIPGDEVILTEDTTGIFERAVVGAGIKVSTFMNLTGGNAGNYTLSQPTGLIADIIPKNLTITVQNSEREAGAVDPQFEFVDFSDLLAESDVISDITGGTGSASDVDFILSSTNKDSEPGEFANEISIANASLDGPKVNNYTITIVAGTLTITPAELGGFLVEGVNNPAQAGAVNSIQITALDSEGNIKTDFTGTISFSSSDTSAKLPADYTFTLAQKGKAEFTDEVIFYIAGTHWVEVEYAGTKGKQENILVLPATVSTDNENTTLEILSNKVTADGTETAEVRVTLQDAYNNPVSDVKVTFTSDGNAALINSEGQTDAAGQYIVKLTNSVAEVVKVTASYDSNEDNIIDAAVVNGSPAAITFLAGSISAEKSTVTATSPHRADGVDASVITITLRDANSNTISGLAETDFNLNVGENTALSNFTDVGDGNYTFTLSNTVAEDISVLVTASGTLLNNQPNVVFEAGAVSDERSSVTATSPHTADGTDASQVTIVLRDAFDNVISGRKENIEITSTGNAVVGQVSETDNPGIYKAALVNTTAETITLTVSIDEVVLNDQPTVAFSSGAISASKSMVFTNPDTVIADGIEKSVISIILKDNEGNAVSGESSNIVFSGLKNATAGVVTETETLGTYLAEVANTKSELIEVRVTAAGTLLDDAADINFIPGAISAAHSLVEVSPDTLPVKENSVIQITLRDKNSNIISGIESQLQITLSGDASIVEAITETEHGSGIYEAVIRNEKVEKVTATVSEIDGIIIGDADIVFTAGDASNLAILSGNDQQSIVADTLQESLMVLVTDADGNPVPGVNVGFEVNFKPKNSTLEELLNVTSITDHEGIASAEFRLGEKVGTYNIKVSSTGLTDVVFSADAVSGVAVAGNSIAVIPDGKVADTTSIIIQVSDLYGNAVAGVSEDLTIALSGANTGTEIAEISDNGDGTYSSSYVPLKPGDDIFDIKLSEEALSGNPFTSTVIAGDLKALVVVQGDGQTQEVTETLADSIVVQLLDKNDLPVPGKTVEFQIANLPENSEDYNLSHTSVVSDKEGLAKTEFTLGTKSGEYIITAKTDTLDLVQIKAVATAGEVKNFALIGGGDQEQPTLSVLKDSLTVGLFDQYQNPVPNEPVVFKLMEAPEFSEGSEILPDTAITQNDGYAKASFKLGDTGGRYQIAAKAYRLPIDELIFNVYAFDKRTNPTVIDTVNTVVFNGDMNTFMYAEPDPTLDSLENLTFEIWVLPKSVENYFELMKKEGDGENSKQFSITGEKNEINAIVHLNNGNSVTLSTQNVFEADETAGKAKADSIVYKWTHLALTVDNNTKRATLYKNGFRVDASDFKGEIRNGDAQLEFGRGFDGEVHEIRIWNKANSRNEIQSRMTQILSGNEENLVLYHTFDDDGDVADDLTGNGNDLHLGNGVNRNFSVRGIPDIEMLENEEYIMAFKAVDEFGSSLNTIIERLPTNGALYQVVNGSEAGAEITSVPAILSDPLNRTLYRPSPNFSGQDSVQYSLVDELGNSAGANRRITIYPVYKAPTPFLQLLPLNNDSIRIAVRGEEDKTSVRFNWEASESFGQAETKYILTVWDEDGETQTIEDLDENSYLMSMKNSILKYNKAYFWRVAATDGIDTTMSVSEMEFVVARDIPLVYQLHQNYPNPFNPTTKIEYWVPVTSKVRIEIFDVLGRQVQILLDEDNVMTGTYQVTWDARSLASGVYFYRMTSQGINGSRFVKMKQMTLIK